VRFLLLSPPPSLSLSIAFFLWFRSAYLRVHGAVSVSVWPICDRHFTCLYSHSGCLLDVPYGIFESLRLVFFSKLQYVFDFAV
jgi:hypothetical protein